MYIRRALSKKVTVAPRSQTNRNVFGARLNRSVDKSAERREDGRLFQISYPVTYLMLGKKLGNNHTIVPF